MVAVAAAAAVAIATVGSSGGGAPARHGNLPVTTAADGPKQMVLAAAVQAERQKLGRYLTVHSRHCFTLPVRAKVGTYFIATCDETWQWQARDKENNSAIWARDLARHPLTPRDKALWKKAGSPRTFPYQEDPKRFPNMYKAEATPWKEDPSDRNENTAGFFIPGKGREISAKELQDMPTDSQSLRKLFLRDPNDPKFKHGGIPVGAGQDIVELAIATQDLPLPPKTWAGVIRLLTETPGVRAIGKVKDPLGREGVALEAPRTSHNKDGDDGTSMERVIFDAKTGALLAQSSTTVDPGSNKPGYLPGTLENYDVRISTTWSDAKPTRPPRG
jgi:hypothetical protein